MKGDVNVKKIKLVAMDLDGTLSQHKQYPPLENKAALAALAQRYKLLMVGAGTAMRIFNQLEQFPIDVLGNYGLQYGEYNQCSGELEILRDLSFPCERESVEKRVTALREKYGFTRFVGDNVEYHASGCVTFPILGTKAALEDKLAFDPDRKKRRAIYEDIVRTFPEYKVFVGGASSFDMAPHPYDKRYALEEYCRERGIAFDEVVYIGDDYGLGGNDEGVYHSNFNYLTIDDYHDFPKVVACLLDGLETKME